VVGTWPERRNAMISSGVILFSGRWVFPTGVLGAWRCGPPWRCGAEVAAATLGKGLLLLVVSRSRRPASVPESPGGRRCTADEEAVVEGVTRGVIVRVPVGDM